MPVHASTGPVLAHNGMFTGINMANTSDLKHVNSLVTPTFYQGNSTVKQ